MNSEKQLHRTLFMKIAILNFVCKQIFCTKSCLKCKGQYLGKGFLFSVKTYLKKYEAYGESSNNLSQNIWRLFQVLAQFPLATSERELDYYHRKLPQKLSPKLQNE